MEEKPSNANEACVGPSSENAGKADGCAGCPNQSRCASGEMKKRNPAQDAINSTMARVHRIILVLSGKGGVGKSTFSAQLAFGLARKGRRVGLMDVDICGPSVPLMLGLRGQEVKQSASGWQPVYVDVEADEGVAIDDCELGVMSIGFLMPDPDSAVIWRGPKKNGLIQQFFTSVDWGELDYLIVDTPPGTSDEHISIVQLLKESFKPGDGAIVVTTPQEVAMMDVRKELNFCKQTKLNVLGVVENMSTALVDLTKLKFVDKSSGECSTNKTLELLKLKCPELLNHAVELENVSCRERWGPKRWQNPLACLTWEVSLWMGSYRRRASLVPRLPPAHHFRSSTGSYRIYFSRRRVRMETPLRIHQRMGMLGQLSLKISSVANQGKTH